MRRFARISLISFGLIMLVVALSACGGNDDPAPQPTATQSPIPPTPMPPTATPFVMPEKDSNTRTAAQLRVIHAAPDLPSLDLYLDGEFIGPSWNFGTFHNPPLGYLPGDYLLRALPAGANRNDPAIIAQTITLPGSQTTLIVISGTLDAPELAFYTENLDPLPDETARVQVLHAAPSTAPITLASENGPLGEPVVSGALSEPVRIEAGSHELTFSTTSATLATVEQRFRERNVYTFLLVEGDTPGTIKVLDIQSRARSATQIRVIHASPDSPAYDVALDETPLASDLAFLAASDWLTMPSYSYLLTLRPAGEPDADPLYQKQITLKPDTVQDIVILNVSDQLNAITIEEDHSPTPANAARLMFVNAAVGTRRFEVEIREGALPDLKAISFANESKPIDLIAGSFPLYFVVDDNDTPLQVDDLPERTWEAGRAYLVVVTGTPQQDPVVVETSVGTSDLVLSDNYLLMNPDQTTGADLQLRVVNALMNDAPVDVLIDGDPIFTQIEPATTTGYRTLTVERATFTIRDSATGTELNAMPYVQADATQVTLFIYRGLEGVTQYPVADENHPLSQQARLRVLNVAPNLPDLQIIRREDPFRTEIEGLNGTPIAIESAQSAGSAYAMSDLVRFAIPTGQFVVPAATYDVHILDNADARVIQVLPQIAFAENIAYELIIFSDPSGTEVEATFIAHQ